MPTPQQVAQARAAANLPPHVLPEGHPAKPTPSLPDISGQYQGVPAELIHASGDLRVRRLELNEPHGYLLVVEGEGGLSTTFAPRAV